MNPEKITTKKGFARVPHGIIEAPLSPNMRLLLCYCHSKPADWTFSAADISCTLQFSNRTAQVYVKTLSQHGVLVAAGHLKVKHGYIPIYTFCPDSVDSFIKAQLTQKPTQEPPQELPQEPTQGKLTNNNNIPRMITKNDATKNEVGHFSQTALKSVEKVHSIGLTSTEIEELSRKSGLSVDHFRRQENHLFWENVYGPKESRPRTGFDSLI
jgi:hypothetical protein